MTAFLHQNSMNGGGVIFPLYPVLSILQEPADVEKFLLCRLQAFCVSARRHF